ncbi:CYTH domain-containing protein [Streptomyces olivaceus]|uniref:class IV adenylate cyclase n=1 Tax=Streptomyces olivaceus TaxID=47716 RepID=UPI001CCDF933|nr:CYTH domain-containing protein [Streptomyces olivaceus]MBZ6081326.1 CYTH domain-containing protein [Streptomyces olivaceus]
MASEIEHEGKVLDIDPETIVAAIIKAGGAHVTDRMMRRFVYNTVPVTPTKWIRLRDDGEQVTLCVKEIVSDAIDGTRETEVVVSDFDTANALLQELGFPPKAYQENRRSSWLLDGVQMEIDYWPLIPPYLEIEGASPDEVYGALDAIGLPSSRLTSVNTTEVYRRHGIDLGEITDLRFPE